jgi:hypothetical protein
MAMPHFALPSADHERPVREGEVFAVGELRDRVLMPWPVPSWPVSAGLGESSSAAGQFEAAVTPSSRAQVKSWR